MGDHQRSHGFRFRHSIAMLVVFGLIATAGLVPAAAQSPPDPDPAPGGVFVTGQDPDFHAHQGPNHTGARRIIQAAVGYVTHDAPDPAVLLVTSVVNPGSGHSDPRLGLTAAGYGFDVADDGSAGGAIRDLTTVDLDDYDVIVVASDFGGWLRQGEVDALVARTGELIDWINAGGGLVAFAQSGRLVATNRFGFLPFLVSDVPLDQTEVGYQVTEFGQTLGLTNADINGNFSHNVFTETGGMDVVAVDAQGRNVTLATRGEIDEGGVVDPDDPPVVHAPIADAGDDQTVAEGSVVTLDATGSAASGLIAKRWATTGDFREGESINLQDLADQLRLDDTQRAFDFMWVAASARGTVVKIDTRTGEVVGEYWSGPQNLGKDPSRTTVDKNGNVWVGNRAENGFVGGVRKGSVTRIGLAENGQCEDRNGNGVIDTSSGLGAIRPWPNAGGPDTPGGVSTAQDECITHYVRTNGGAIRQVSVDADNHVWVGGAAQGGSPRFFDRIDPAGTIVRSINMASAAETGRPGGVTQCCYGGLVDGNGILWSASAGGNALLRIDPSRPNGDSDLIRVTPLGRTSYGLGIDPDGFMWLSNWTSNTIQKISPDGVLLGTFPSGGPSNDRGVAVTDDGDVWVANSGGASVSRLDTNGAFKTQVPVGTQPTGVAVDAAGKVWSTNLSSNNVSRIDPTTNAVDLTVSLGAGAGPYNYSDMTGSTLSGAPDEGTWTVVHDSGVDGANWALADWNADVTGDGSVRVFLASSHDGTTFGPMVEVSKGDDLSAVADGRYVRVTVRFVRSSAGVSPVLHDLVVARTGGDTSLSYQWELVSQQGPPIFLSSTTSPTPSFVAPDDARYRFELTVTDTTGLTATDEVTVVVDNADPVLTIEPGSSFAGGVTLLNGSFTDPGWLDVHDATIDWGDGRVDEVAVTAQGSGWGTFFGSHVYQDAGTYRVEVTLRDDDGGRDTRVVEEFRVADPVAVWANREGGSRTLDWSGSSGTIVGRIHTNGELRFVGQTKTVQGPATYAGKLAADTVRHIFDPPPVEAPVEDFPVRFDIADYRPDGPVALQVGDAYHDMSAECDNGTWHQPQEVLAPGVYYADCAIQLNGSDLGGAVTLAAEGWIKLAGSRPAFEPFHGGVLAVSGWAGTSRAGVEIATSTSKFLGVLFAEHAAISVTGSDNRFFCGLLGDTIDLSGARVDIRAADCGQPADTVAGPLLVPDLTLDLDADVDEVLPADTIGYDLRVTNDGALLVAPGLFGLENVDDAAATVTGFDYTLEWFSIADGLWLPLASTVDGAGEVELDLSLQANEAAGVDYPADDDPVGTAIDPGGLATWGHQALVQVSAERVAALLDPAITGGLRNRVDFTLDPASVQVRRLYTFGTDFVDDLRALSGQIHDVEVTFIPPEGDLVTFDAAADPTLADLAPGAMVGLGTDFDVAVPAPRGDGETDSGYVARLAALDGTVLTGAAFALAAGGVGRLIAPLALATATERVPAVALTTRGPDALPAGSAGSYTFDLANRGSTTATSLTLAATAGDDPLSLDGVPSELDGSQLASASATFTAPEDGTADVTVTGEVTWQDGNGNAYGPVRSDRATDILAPGELAATLTSELIEDVGGTGFASPGDTLRYTLQVRNDGGQPLTGVSATVPPDPNSVLVVGSVLAGDHATVVTGNGAGDDRVEVAWSSIAAGSVEIVTFDVTVAEPFPDGVTRLEVQGTLTADGFDPVLTDDPARPGAADPTRTTIVVPRPALTANLSGRLLLDRDGNGVASAGDRLRYMLTVHSIGSLGVSDVEVAVPLPAIAGLVPGSVTTDAGTAGPGPDVAVDIGALGPFQNATIEFDVDLATPLAPGTASITLQGTVTSAELDPVVTDDPGTFLAADPTVIAIGAGPGGGGPVLPGPTIGDLSLDEGAILTAPTSVSVTLSPRDDAPITAWSIGYRRDGDSTVTELASSDTVDLALAALVSEGDVEAAAEIDPTVMPNGLYWLVVTAESADGGTSRTETSFVVDGQLKLGRYVTSYLDLDVGIGGLPLQIRRTYDSVDRSRGDFGIGWTVDVVSFAVATNGPLGLGGWTAESCGPGLIFVPLCYSSVSPHYVTVTWPDGRNEVFDLTPARGSTFLTGLTSAEFTGRPGTTSTLEALDTTLWMAGGNLYGGLFGSQGLYDPARFRLTDKHGTEYLLDRSQGLLSVEDPAGNRLTIGSSGITSSLGRSVAFIRDGFGRITSIDGPDALDLTYSYDANGDLASFTDPNGNTTTYTYDDHRLIAVDGPDATRLSTLVYEDGRLIAITDADGNTTAVEIDVDARTETVTSPDGRLTTISAFDDRGNQLRVDEVFDGQTATSTFAYDDNDNVVLRRDPTGNEWRGQWEGRDLVSFEEPDGNGIEIVYNDLSLPESWTDQRGNTTRYVWNPDGTLERIVDAAGEPEVYTYDAGGLLATRTDRAGNTWSWTYTPNGQAATETDPLGNITRFEYHPDGRLWRTIDAAGGVTTRSYDATGNLTREEGPEGDVTQWISDVHSRLETVIDPEGNETRWTYTDGGRPASITNHLDEATAHAYDAAGRLASTTIGSLAPTTYEYDGAGRLIRETDPTGNQTTHTYDLAGQLRSSRNAARGETTYAYDGAGRLLSRRDPSGGETTYSYWLTGQVRSVRDPLDRTTSYTYDVVGRLEQVLNPDGSQVTYDYDAAGRLRFETDEGDGTREYRYDAAGNRTHVIDATGRATTTQYDGLGRVVSVADALGRAATYTYDGASRMTSSVSAEGVATTIGYDRRGLPTTRTDALGNTWTTDYDAAGRTLRERDPRGAQTVYGYDDAGRLEQITDDAGNTITFGYDDAGRRTSLTDPRSQTWSYTHAPQGGLATETDPLGNVRSWTYDPTGRPVSYTDGRGVTRTYGYDTAGQLTSITHPSGRVDYGYQVRGWRSSMTDDTGTTTWSYDPTGRVTGIDAPGGDVTYAYDAAGRRAAMTTQSLSASYTYDAAGGLTSIASPQLGTVGLTVDGDGRVRLVERPNGITTTHGFDAAGRTDRIEHAGPSGAVEWFDYGYDPAGNATSVASSTGTESYTINRLNQLVQADLLDGTSLAWDYDTAGNRTSERVDGAIAHTYSYDAASRLTDIDGDGLTYDGDGNLVAAGSDTFTWDWAGRLTQATIGGTTVTHAYDGDGLRTSTTVGGVTSPLVYDRLASVPRLVGDGTSAWLHDDLTVLASTSGGSASWPLVDALGSVRAVTGPTGATTASGAYTPFGTPTATSGDLGPFGFAGAVTEPAGLLDLQARWLDPATGRFLSTDPVRPGAPGVAGYNLYTYAGNNPTTWTDPTGAATAVSRATLGLLIIAVAGVTLSFSLSISLQQCLDGGPCAIPRNPPNFPWDRGRGGTRTTNPPRIEELTQRLLERLPALTKEAAEAAVAACIGLNIPDLFVDIDSPCTSGDLRIYFSGGADQPVQTGHIVDAQLGRPDWIKLHRRIEPHPRGWMDAKPVCIAARAAGDVCDEYPFASTHEGGPLNGPSLRAAPQAESALQGGTLGGFYRRNACAPFGDGTLFVVVPVPLPFVPTFSLCK